MALAVVGFEGIRLLTAIRDLQDARVAVGNAIGTVERAGISMTRADAATIDGDLALADADLSRSEAAIRGDPLIALVRLLPPVATQVDAATVMIGSAQRLTSMHGALSALLGQYIAIRDSSAGPDRIAAFINLVDAKQALIQETILALRQGRASVAALADDGLTGTLDAVRVEMDGYLGRLGALADAAEPLLPVAGAMLGAHGPRRYLVLALDSAELRPIGGLVVAFAVLTVNDGRLGDIEFQDILAIDRADQHSYVAPPQPLQDHLLGDFTWQVADAGWWPDFARSAAEARRMYAIETGDDDDFDGVIAFTPDFVDSMIEVTGPVEVPGTGITVLAGQTYLRSLEAAEVTGVGPTRKRFLGLLAAQVLRRVENLPTEDYPALVSVLGRAVERRQIQVLPDDAAARAAMITTGAYSPFTFDDGDRLAIMSSNVAPVSKLDLLLDVDHTLDVELHADGSANEHLRTTYVNTFGPNLPLEFQRVAKAFFFGNLGAFERRYLPPDAEVLDVRSSGVDATATDPETLEVESGSLAVGNYLYLSPGRTDLETDYRAPHVVLPGNEPDRWVYRLDFRKQPGRDRDGLTVKVSVPPGGVPSHWSAGGVLSGSTVTFSTTTEIDRQLEVEFLLPT